jgi:carbonic anhydrase
VVDLRAGWGNWPKWIVPKETLEVSQEQVQAFLDLFPDGNSREVQLLNERTVQFDDEE